ncbi:MAG: acyl-CoA dehydrogenase [Burkholderiales bacterium]
MGNLDLDHLRTWLGKSRTDEDVILARHAGLMAATVDYPAPERIRDGAPLPSLWHWIYFLEALPQRELGRDGHPARGGFLPPVPLSNRMWAGGRVFFAGSIPIGSVVRKESSILKIDHKRGRSGDLVFVTVLHELKSLHGELLVREEHDIVYREPTPPDKRSGAPANDTPVAQFTRTYTPTSTMLFRYSALTFNGHRIHYDVDYCRNVEGYDNLVIHGPLNATMLANYAEAVTGRRLRQFSYRGLAPAILGATLTLHAVVDSERAALWLTLPDGVVSMRAEATVE